MSEKKYNLEFSGQVIPGWDIDEVKANLAKLLKADEEKVYKLFSGGRFVIKKNIDRQTALKINNVLKDAGADCVIVPRHNNDPATPPPMPSQTGLKQPDQMPAPVARLKLEPSEIRPKRIWYFVAALLFLIPMIAGGISIFKTISSYFSGGTLLTVPGETTIEAMEAGTYYFFYETSVFTEFNIAKYQIGKDFDITLMDLATGAELKLKPAAFGGTETYGTIVRQAIAEVEFDSVGYYHAEVAGELPNGDGLLVRRVDYVAVIKGIISAIVLFFVGFMAGPVMALVVLVKRQNNKNKQLNKPMSDDEERKWAMFAHIGTFSSMFVPLGNIIAPIVIWQMKKKDSSFVVEQAKESLNFQISLMLYGLISILLIFIIIGIFLIFALVIFSLIMVIVAGVKANEGEHYRYPLSIRFVK
ncbi:MAG: DUF4870 domain-containing protein [Desulfobacterales bacterium]|jgi:uncharacterized Tic20 family protein